MQPEVPFSKTTDKKLKWFGQELTELWKEKSNDKGRIFIFLAINPKCQGDLEGQMIFYMTQSYMDYQDLSDQFVAQSKVIKERYPRLKA